MRKLELMELLETRKTATTEELITKLLPKLSKVYIFARLDDVSLDMPYEEKAKTYNRLRVYKNRIQKGERNEKMLSEVFKFLGYEPITTVWGKDDVIPNEETTTDQN